MHEDIVEVVRGRLLVFFGAEPGHALLADVGCKGVQTADKDIEPQVELFLVDEIRIGDVFLDHVLHGLLLSDRLVLLANDDPLILDMLEGFGDEDHS